MSESTLQHAINWFEIPASQYERAKKFYSTVLAGEIKTVEMGPMTMGFLPTDFSTGAISGAIAQGPDRVPGTAGPVIFLNGGADLSVLLNRVEGAGGKVVMPKTSIGEFGSIAYFMDSEGNRVGLHDAT